MSELPSAEIRQAVLMWQTIDEEHLADIRSQSEGHWTRKETSSTSTQTDKDISNNELPIEGPTQNWKAVAEERRVALEKALNDNEELHKSMIALTEQNAKYKDMLDEANSFIEVCKSLLEENADDTGIDLGDSSGENNDSNEN